MWQLNHNVLFFRFPVYQGGCVGVAVLEECGGEALYTFIDTFRSLYGSLIDLMAMNSVCSSEITRTVKSSFIGNLNMMESRKMVYRAIFGMDKE